MADSENKNQLVTTKSIGSNIANVEEDFILEEKPQSRLVFQAQIHEGGIRGKIVRQRRESTSDSWVPDLAIDIRSLGKKESINIELHTEAVSNFYTAIQKLSKILQQKGIRYGETQYAVVDPKSVVITDSNKIDYIRKLLEAGYSQDVWETLIESNPSLATKLSHSKIQSIKEAVVRELENRLRVGGFKETIGADSWQNWIYTNNWLFGVNYKKPIEKTKINLTGIMPDFLFPTLDGFVDLLEIKLPNAEVLLSDNSHPGSWKWCAETNSAIGQVVNYIGEIDRLRLEIEKNVFEKYSYKISLLRPRSFILIGDSTKWPNEKKEALRKMNYALHGITVLTYKDLLDRGIESTNFSETIAI